MPAPKKRPARAAASAPTTFTVLLDNDDAKKHSVKYYSEQPDLPFNNLYVSMKACDALGNPAAIKVTIEAA
jgi:hypothetical protein